MPKNLGYTYYCAEEPTSRVPATSIALIVEPGAVLVVQMKRASLAACEAEYLEALHLDMTSDMPWKTMLVGTTKNPAGEVMFHANVYAWDMYLTARARGPRC